MLRIRFSRTGKVGQPSFRIVVSEKSKPLNGRHLEVVGNYMPARQPKVIAIKKERIVYWISKGALPTNSVASLLKNQGMADMDKYIEPGNRKRRKKGEEPAKTAAAPAATTATPTSS